MSLPRQRRQSNAGAPPGAPSHRGHWLRDLPSERLRLSSSPRRSTPSAPSAEKHFGRRRAAAPSADRDSSAPREACPSGRRDLHLAKKGSVHVEVQLHARPSRCVNPQTTNHMTNHIVFYIYICFLYIASQCFSCFKLLFEVVAGWRKLRNVHNSLSCRWRLSRFRSDLYLP